MLHILLCELPVLETWAWNGTTRWSCLHGFCFLLPSCWPASSSCTTSTQISWLSLTLTAYLWDRLRGETAQTFLSSNFLRPAVSLILVLTWTLKSSLTPQRVFWSCEDQTKVPTLPWVSLSPSWSMYNDTHPPHTPTDALNMWLWSSLQRGRAQRFGGCDIWDVSTPFALCLIELNWKCIHKKISPIFTPFTFISGWRKTSENSGKSKALDQPCTPRRLSCTSWTCITCTQFLWRFF